MKKLAIILLFALLGIASYGQTINDVEIEEVNAKYIMVTAQAKIMNPAKVWIEVDFGQNNKIFSSKDTFIKDKDGKILKFLSIIDALNFWDENGYELVEAYSYEIGNVSKHNYLMRRTR